MPEKFSVFTFACFIFAYIKSFFISKNMLHIVVASGKTGEREKKFLLSQL